MSDKAFRNKYLGKFTLPDGRELAGRLVLASSDTFLHLHDDAFFRFQFTEPVAVTGVLNDARRVSLIDCISLGGGTSNRGTANHHWGKLFPHYVVAGDTYYDADAKSVKEIRFVISDAISIFYDYKAFGTLFRPQHQINHILEADALALQNFNKSTSEEPRIETGLHPVVMYYTGKRQIFASDTILGRVSAGHSISHNNGGPEGLWLKNKVTISVIPQESIDFSTAISSVHTLVNYFGLLIGRPQKVSRININIGDPDNTPLLLDIYWSHGPQKAEFTARRPHPADTLLDGARQTESFSTTLAKWLDKHDTWNDARVRFFGCFQKQRHYSINRLVACANAFDILPPAAVPTPTPLPSDLQEAVNQARKMFAQLSLSFERDDILGTLGRLGRSSLKQKIRHRAQVVIDASGSRFSELTIVTDEAVNCRNYFVHGGDPRFNYAEKMDLVDFFMDTLEFVFGASDLLEVGWSMTEWLERRPSTSHPFGRYCVIYESQLRALKAALVKPSRV